jgi:hypothetical protein
MWTAAIALSAVAAPPAAAQQDTPTLRATTGERGWVSLQATAAPRAVIQVTEGGAEVAQLRADARGRATKRRAVPWRCERRRRTFVATVTGDAAASASATVRTPSCAGRIAVSVGPTRAQAGRPLSVRVRDRWRVGAVDVEVCARAPRGTRQCRTLALAQGRTAGTYRFRPKQSGRWAVSATVPGARAARAEHQVRRRGGGLRILATGDSMIQVVDSFLTQRLESRRVKVRSDARISTGITKPSLLNWPAKARSQASGLRPDVTIVFLGANDGFPIGGAACCGSAWVRAYAARARGMMRSYQRRGSGTVYWLLLPVPSKRQFQPVFRGVNAALRRAARDMEGGVHIVDLPRVFTPGGRFRAQMRWEGQVRTVRQPDGVHLSTAGASIAASVIIRQLRRDGVLG